MSAPLFRGTLLASVLVACFAGAAQAATTLSFGGFTWAQEDAPNIGSEIDSGVHGGATFNIVSSNVTGNITTFPTSAVGGSFNSAVGVLSNLIGDAPGGTRAVNLPNASDIGTAVARRGVSVGWASGTTNGQGITLTNPVLPNLAGNDFVIFESGSSAAPEGMMVRALVVNPGGGPGTYTDWYYAAPTNQTAVSGGVLFGYAYDLSNMGVAANGQVSQIQLANMVASDRIVSNSGTPGGVTTGWEAPGAQAKWNAGGRFGGALEFDGKDDYGTFQSPAFEVGDKGTLSFWVKMDDTGKRNQFFEGPGNAGLEFQYRTNSGGQFFGRGETTGGDFVIQASGAAAAVAGDADGWVNLQYTWDATAGVMRIYFNNVEVAYLAGFDPTLAGFTTATALETANQVMNVGRDPGDTARFFDGMMDDVAWYNDVLSDADRATIFNSGAAALSTSALVAHWTFDETTGNIATDLVNGIEITIDVGVLSSNAQSFLAEGFVDPEKGQPYATDNPGPNPGPLASFTIPFGNATFDADPLYLAPLNNLTEAIPTPAATTVGLSGFAMMALLSRRYRRRPAGSAERCA